MDRSLWLRSLGHPPALRARWVRSVLADRPLSEATLQCLRASPAPWTTAELDALCARWSMRWWTPSDAPYPRTALAGLHDPPPVLFVRGDASLLSRTPAVAVVGARRGTARGRRSARSIGAELARHEVVVVSGLALGVDGQAHEGCLDAGGATVAVMPGGLDRVYPPRHARLYERVLATGVAVSEHPPGVAPRREHFVARNRLVAALAGTLVVVEATLRSGALHTVEFAHQLGRDVFAVPGPVDCPHSEGTLSLLRDGAALVRDGRDVVDSLNLAVLPPAAGPLGLTRIPESPVQIARRLGWVLPRVLAALGEAELLGQVERAGADRWVAASALPPSTEGA